MRHYLFHPDVDVRWASAWGILYNREGYDKDLVGDFDAVVGQDPDPLMKYWHRDYLRDYPEKNRERDVFLRGRVFEKPEIKSSMSLEEVRVFFGVGLYRDFRPNVAAEMYYGSISSDETQKIIDSEMHKMGLLPGRDDGMDMDQVMRRAAIERSRFPSLRQMGPHLYRLPDKERLEAVVNLVVRPTSYITDERPFWDADLMVQRFGLRAVSLLDNPVDQQAILKGVLSTVCQLGEVAVDVTKTMAEVMYMLPLKVVREHIWPVLECYRSDMGVAREAFQSASVVVEYSCLGMGQNRIDTRVMGFGFLDDLAVIDKGTAAVSPNR